VPHREPGGKPEATLGRDTAQMLQHPLKAYLLFGGVEPLADMLSGADAVRALAGAGLVVALTPYASEHLPRIAHVLLPIGTFAETSGTFVNLEGTWQSFTAAASAVGESRPGWRVVRVLGTELALSGFDYQSSEDVRGELRRAAADSQPAGYRGDRQVSERARPAAVVDLPMYQVDALVRRSPSLQRTAEGRAVAATY